MPVPLRSIDFYAQHSPFGAFSSFTVGRFGKKGGFGLELGGPASQDVYVALIRTGEAVRALPFFARDAAQSGSEAEAYTGVQAETTAATEVTNSPFAWQVFTENEIKRTLGWASDTWDAGNLTLRVLTPFGDVDEPASLSDSELRLALCPAILAEITIDNCSATTEALALFGIGAADPLRPLSDSGCGLLGIARESQWGFAVAASSDARETLSWALEAAIAEASAGKEPPLNRLANRGGLLLHVPAGETRTFTIALGFYRGGIVTSGISSSYLYSRLFPDLESVLSFALENADYYRQTALNRDAELDAAAINDERKFLLAHATHSYHGSTMLLHDEKGAIPLAAGNLGSGSHRPLWVVNEGEYRMLNTFDLTVDHAFWEMKFHPWTLRNALDQFVERYSYFDDTQDVRGENSGITRQSFPGGISFTHDMGVANQFTRPGHSSYELPNLDGCFSYMTQEQLCNWCLCAALYALPASTGPASGWSGDSDWLASRKSTLEACLVSLMNRDGPEGKRDGVMNLDAARCAEGQEITTYDSLDESLGQARANGYLAVKTWASYLALAKCFETLGDPTRAESAQEQAALAAATVVASWDTASDAFPSVMEPDNPGWKSRIIPAIEGLAYPLLWGDRDAVAPDGPYGELVSLLRRHFLSVLRPGLCIDETTGGWKLSSSTTNTWMSKIFLSQFVAETVLGVQADGSCDAAHARWQRDGTCRDFAFTDQVVSDTGRDLGSRYYPRGVTAILWL